MALKGITGSLVSPALLQEKATQSPVSADLRRTIASAMASLGPASSARHVFDRLAAPLLAHFQLDWSTTADSTAGIVAMVPHGRPQAIVAAGGWNADLRELREASGRACRTPARWWIGTNGATLRLLDATRAYTRRSLDFDLLLLSADDVSLGALECVLGESGLAALGDLIVASERHRTAVGRSLQT